MADHGDAADPRLDITDLFVFPAPEDPGSTVVILNLHPDAPEALSGLDPDASYELKIDTNGDAEADVALQVLFAAPPDDEPTATVYRSTGRSARRTGRQGELLLGPAPVSLAGSVRVTARDACRFFAGVRSDPWFVDIAGFFDDFRWTGRDYFAERNIFGIVLEVPNIVLGATGPTGIWARTMAPGPELTMGRVTGDGIGPHADLLDEFPYLGAPHRRGP